MSAIVSYSLLGAIASASIVFAWYCQRRALAVPLPPGPRPWPILGNLKDLRPEQPWLTASQWARKYGSIVYVHVLGKGIIYLNTEEAVSDIMEKRTTIYSDKPELIMLPELCGAGNMLAFTGYGDSVLRQRSLMTHFMNQMNIEQGHHLLEFSVHGLATRVLANPDHCFKHIRQYAAGIVLRIVYGIELREGDGSLKYLDLVERTTSLLANQITARGGIWAVDIFPFLKHLPAWFPGAGFKHKAALWRETVDALRELPWAAVKANVASGTASPSFCSMFLNQSGRPLTAQEELDIKNSANSMYTASMDTTAAVASHFLLAMLFYPGIMRRAQQELDHVLGGNRLPTLADRGRLPFIDAIFEESLRWGCPMPLGLPHAAMEDDEYKGMRIPKGSIVFANIWNILRDENIYPNPDIFEPERFLDKSQDGSRHQRQRDPRPYVFGFGRRRCPATHLVESSGWLLIATMLSVFDILRVVDPITRHPIEPQIIFENCAFRTPSEFKVNIRPRPTAGILLSQPPFGSSV
ncbi:hypothetical protein EW146_g5214 [Bondarzewia mesenterica]|uniref:Cytochrome P450 n=1 Tax=Bondarzewia mesenterica TaxID=1095465 RepID=A0A4S4LU06_9AGAM|nr:hypothetical protein EW146_g5214 [Bondarzewia mesenterica]